MSDTRVRVVAVSFPAFLKLNLISGLGVGLLLGLLHPIGELFGARIVGGIEAPWATGPVGWLVYLIVFPLMFLFLSLLFAVVAFLPARLLLHWVGGIDLVVSAKERDVQGP